MASFSMQDIPALLMSVIVDAIIGGLSAGAVNKLFKIIKPGTVRPSLFNRPRGVILRWYSEFPTSLYYRLVGLDGGNIQRILLSESVVAITSNQIWPYIKNIVTTFIPALNFSNTMPFQVRA